MPRHGLKKGYNTPKVTGTDWVDCYLMPAIKMPKNNVSFGVYSSGRGRDHCVWHQGGPGYDVISPLSPVPEPIYRGTINSHAKADLGERIPNPQEPEPALVHGDEPPPSSILATAMATPMSAGKNADVESTGEHLRHPGCRSQARIARRRRALERLGGCGLLATLHYGTGGLTFVSFPIPSIPRPHPPPGGGGGGDLAYLPERAKGRRGPRRSAHASTPYGVHVTGCLKILQVA
ncbi:hypothetical protein DL764_010664 [Monosporascus ibericus]|uniref:Uncharacterized protein n=1 Tax=Monosporascus ibericus TaxID=155417 RepID=A0A4Q4STS6_9PEZI|nr:hypothetical protein DL764_010664 [Monosporascus ibericus]